MHAYKNAREREPITILDVPGLYITIVEINLVGTSSLRGREKQAGFTALERRGRETATKEPL